MTLRIIRAFVEIVRQWNAQLFESSGEKIVQVNLSSNT
jgi:hypothetical protein